MFRYFYSVLLECKDREEDFVKSKLSSAQFLKKSQNEPAWQYLKESSERVLLEKALANFGEPVEVPIIIGSENVNSTFIQQQIMPSDHSRSAAKFYYATKVLINKAIDNCLKAREEWERKPLKERAGIFLKAADLAANEYRIELVVATMLGQAKNVMEAEIDVCQLIDHFRFNVLFALQAEQYKPISELGVTNKYLHRGLDGFVAAISPFSSTAVVGNLCAAPVLMGNVVVWKPSSKAILSSYVVFKILREAGLPPGVINFVPCNGATFGDSIVANRNLAGINFTGSATTFRWLWKHVAINIERYKVFPRLVGECGGKNFHFVHSSADVDSVVYSTIRAAFEYQGQKSSACSRLYVPQCLWPEIKQKLLDVRSRIVVGQPSDNKAFMSAVIDRRAFDRIYGFIQHANTHSNLSLIAGGECEANKGYFVKPTIIECRDTADKLFTDEIFGPVLCVHVYPNDRCEEILKTVKNSTPFRLTGSVFASDKEFIQIARSVLREAAGNFYINDKCTGSIIGQQAFDGAGNSGTNDKSGDPHNILKWSSPLTIKEVSKPQRAVCTPLD